MKSFFRFILFAIAFVSYTSNIFVNADDHNNDPDCLLNENLPASILKYCPDLKNDLTLKTHSKKIIQATHKRFKANCPGAVTKICQGIPSLIKKHNAGGHENCKEELRDLLCTDFAELKRSSHCLHHKIVSHVMSKPQRWEKGQESELCQILLDTKDVLCLTTIPKICDRIEGSQVARSVCRRIMMQHICSNSTTVWTKLFFQPITQIDSWFSYDD